MDKRVAGLLGAAAALTTLSAANATAAPVQSLAPATSYRDLLAPVPNAVAALKADDARRAVVGTGVQLAQYDHHHHHHHHHHHRVFVPPPFRPFVRRHHHHHHHHHHQYRRGYE
jgi:hypothetical protein